LVTQYTRGRAAEYRAMQLLKREEWIVGRSAGSHSPVDLFAAKKGKVLLVQVKNGSARVKKVEMTELVKWAVHFDADAEVWFFRGRGELERKRVHTSTDRSR
jgi:Holliday junction resolvase